MLAYPDPCTRGLPLELSVPQWLCSRLALLWFVVEVWRMTYLPSVVMVFQSIVVKGPSSEWSVPIRAPIPNLLL